jgi:hypothetical protein
MTVGFWEIPNMLKKPFIMRFADTKKPQMKKKTVYRDRCLYI